MSARNRADIFLLVWGVPPIGAACFWHQKRMVSPPGDLLLARPKSRKKPAGVAVISFGISLSFKTAAPRPQNLQERLFGVPSSITGACNLALTPASAARSLLRAKSLASLGCAMYTRLRAGALRLALHGWKAIEWPSFAVSACCAAALMLRSKTAPQTG